MNKKGAVELSMTTIIVIVIGVVLLSLGLMWVRGVFTKISGLTTQAFIQADQEIREKMGGDAKFYVSGQTFDIKPGEKLTINVGIQNFGETGDFKLTVTSAGGTGTGTITFITPSTAQSIGASEKKGLPIVAVIPKNANPGDTYLYKVSSTKDNAEYASEVIVINIIS